MAAGTATTAGATGPSKRGFCICIGVVGSVGGWAGPRCTGNVGAEPVGGAGIIGATGGGASSHENDSAINPAVIRRTSMNRLFMN